jgi:hypothetical protein
MRDERLDNLEQWDRALEQLDDWKHAGQLDSHQADLLWLLRFRDNWRLREAALEMTVLLQVPEPELIRQVCDILIDDSLYYELRVLAAEALAALFSRDGPDGPHDACADSVVGEVRECARQLLASTQPPVVHLALQRVLSRIE